MANETNSELKQATEAHIAAQKELKKLEAELAVLSEKKTKRAKEQAVQKKKEVETAQKLVTTTKQQAEFQKKINKDTDAFGKSWSKLSGVVQKNLGGTNKNATVYASIASKISVLEAKQASLTGDELDANMELVSRLREQNDSLLQQAKMTANAEDKARGLNDIAIQKKQLEEEITKAKEVGNDELRESLELEKQALELKETLEKKENRLTSIAESQKEIMDALPDGIKSGIGFAQKLGTALKTAGIGAGAFVLLASVVVATLDTFTKLDEAAESFRKETGLTNSQTKGIKSDANEIVGEFANLGVNAEKVFDTISALKSEFSDVASFSKETTAALTVLNANFGVTADTAAKVQSQFESIGGISSETAASVQMQVADMANLAGVAPKKVFEDIAENAEATSTFFKGDLNALTKNAIQARRMGTSLKEQVSLAEKLLDFESGIEEELVAATFVGGQFNLGRARALAMEGKLAEANAETLKQIQRSGDFRKQDYFTQQQLAKAAGMSVEEVNKQLNAQDKLSKLSSEERKKAEDAIAQGLDITNINEEQLAQKTKEFEKQKEIQGSLTNVKNTFDGLIASVGSTFLPIMQGLASVFEFISSSTAGLVGFVGTLATLFGVIYGIKLKTFILQKASAAKEAYAASKSIVGAIASIFGGQGKLPIIGAVIAAAMVGSLFAALSKGASFAGAGDVSSPADGKTRISTKEGGLFELSPNDDLVAAPGAASALAGATEGGTTMLSEGKSGGTNLVALSAPLNAMINEIKALRADLNSGKIAVYMDTAKVTSNISANVDQGTRNSFNMSST
jgi:Mg2+ and Co2+ transporter CorA